MQISKTNIGITLYHAKNILKSLFTAMLALNRFLMTLSFPVFYV